MRSFIVLVVVCAVVGLSQAMSKEELKAATEAMMADCKVKEGASDADVSTIAAHQIPATKTGKCLGACLMEAAGIVKDGKPSVEGAINMAKMVFDGNEESVAKAKEVATECEHVADADRCELALKLEVCIHEALAKRGMSAIF